MPYRGLCRHCRDKRVCRPRGLCWRCWHDLAVRDQYPSVSKYANRGFGNSVDGDTRPAEPTDGLPGSPVKMDALHERARRGEALWHPEDLRVAD